MQLHQLKSNHKIKKAKRVGRGGKRGFTSGRGQKGQKARAGHRIRPASRDLLMRLPKLRGVKNKPKGPKLVILNLDDIKNLEGIISLEILKEKGFLRKHYRGGVKILGRGEAKKGWQFKDLRLSKSAKIKIERAGGKILNPKS